MFGIGGDPFQVQQQGPWSAGPGPLGELQNQVAGVLNAADQNHVYVPLGAGQPVLQFPRPQVGYRQAAPSVSPRPSAAPLTGPRGWAAVVFLIVVAALVAVAVIALTGG